MANDATQLLSPGDGTVWVAAVGTTAPTDESSAPSGWSNLGFIDENGVQIDRQPAFRDRNAWQSLLPIGKIRTGETFQITYALEQWNRTNYSFAFGGGTWTNPSGSTWKFVPPAPTVVDYRASILDAYDGTYRYRWVFPRGIADGQVQSKLALTEDAKLPITFSITPATSTDNPYIFYTNNPNA